MFFTAPPAARLPFPYRPEFEVLSSLLATLNGAVDWPAAVHMARPWVQAVRDKPAPFWAMESLLREYPISSAEGLALMRLAEALLRVPDAETAIALTADQLGKAEFDAASGGPHKMLANLSASAIALSKKFLPENDGRGDGQSGLFKRLGAQTVVAATVRAIRQDDGSGLDLILAHELYGLVPLCFGRAPGTALYIDAQRAFFALERHGNVTCREPPSPALCTLLRALARGARTKEDLIREVWRLNVYRPTKHDAVVHTAVSRLRTALEPHTSWIVVAGAGYGLAPGVAVVEVGEAADAPGVEMPDEGGAPSAPAPPPPDAPDPRRAAALALIERAEGAATRDIAEALKISEMTAFRVLGALVDEGLIERTGRGRSTRYIRCR